MNMTQMDVFSRLMMDRIIFLGTGINDQVANIINAQLLFLESVDAKKDIQIYLNSPGGSVYAGLGIYDTMQYIRPDVATVCIGQAASMGSFLLTAGAKGQRFALPNARVMIHQPSGGARGQAVDIEIQAKEILDLRERLNKIYAKHTGQKKKTIEESLSDLEKLVAELENGELELDQALKKFEQGVKLSRECKKTLEETEMKIKILMEGELKTTDENLK